MKKAILATVFTVCFSFVNAQILSVNNSTIVLQVKNDIATISWTMKKEVNTSYFLIQNSTDSINFSTVKTIKSYGSSQLPIHYETEDVLLDTNIQHYYRVVLVLMEGHQIVSNMVCTKQYLPLAANYLVIFK